MKYKTFEKDLARMGGTVCMKKSRMPVSQVLCNIAECGIEAYLREWDHYTEDQILELVQEVSNNIQRWVERDIEEYPRSNWFITVISTDKDESSDDVKFLNTRCFGYMPTLEMAEEAVLNNDGDLHEQSYQWAVIEEQSYGSLAMAILGSQRWYHWNNLYKRFHQVERPEWAKNVVHWGIG